MATVLNTYVESRPGKCGGRPCIAGTRIRVQDIYVWNELRGRSPDEIIGLFPELSLAQVHGALAYFWEHQEEIRKQMDDEEAAFAEFRRQDGLRE